MFTPDIKKVGTFSEINSLRKFVPDAELFDLEFILQGRRFERWYDKNKKVIGMLAMAAPAAACVLFGMAPINLMGLATAGAGTIVKSFIPQAHTAYQAVDAVTTMASAAGGGAGLFTGQGAILLHFLIIGFVTLIITTFLKFTGRGDLAPLVMFVAGGVMLVEVIGLFNTIFNSVKTFLTL